MRYQIGTDGIIYPRPFAQQRARLGYPGKSEIRRECSDRTLILYKNEEAIVHLLGGASDLTYDLSLFEYLNDRRQ